MAAGTASSTQIANDSMENARRKICDLNQNVKIFHENMRSVMTAKQELLRSSDLADYEVITITETWLNAGHKNNEFISSKYRTFRKDRCDTNINAERGGGVLVAVRMDIDCEQFYVDEMCNLESICVKFPLNNNLLPIHPTKRKHRSI